MVDERGGGSEDQEQEVEDPHGVLVLCGALGLCYVQCARAAAHALAAMMAPTWLRSVCRL